MKIAYLMLCHKNSTQINKLIDQLNSDKCCFFVHIDRKCKDLDICQKDNIYIVADDSRVDVKWATISMVEATLELIKCALHSSIVFDYYCLISGQDFPIKRNDDIVSFFNKNKGLSCIEVLEHSNLLYARYRKRNDIYYPQWMFSSKTGIKILKKLYIYLTGGYKKTLKVFRRKYAVNLPFEYGSQWWCLTDASIRWIYDYLIEKEGLNYFKNSMTPDECVFQTSFMISPYKNNRVDKIVYVEWNESLNNARLLKINDLDILLNNEKHLFARKFDMDVDVDIIKALIENLKEE